MFSKTSQVMLRNQWAIHRVLPLAGTLAAAGLSATALAQSVPFPSYTVGENKDAANGPNYPLTCPLFLSHS